MESRGPRSQRGPQPQGRGRGGNHYQQQQPRMINSVTWPGNNISNYTQEDSMTSYRPAPVDTYQNYLFPHSLQPPELMNPNTQNAYPAFSNPNCYGPSAPQVYSNIEPALYMNSQISTTPTSTNINASIPTKKITYNSIEQVIICSNCQHKNCLVEIELIHKDEEISELRNENTSLHTKVLHLQEELDKIRSQMNVAEKTHTRVLQPVDDYTTSNKVSQLSPEAIEFNPKKTECMAFGTDEVPVVSARVINEESISGTHTVQLFQEEDTSVKPENSKIEASYKSVDSTLPNTITMSVYSENVISNASEVALGELDDQKETFSNDAGRNLQKDGSTRRTDKQSLPLLESKESTRYNKRKHNEFGSLRGKNVKNFESGPGNERAQQSYSHSNRRKHGGPKNQHHGHNVSNDQDRTQDNKGTESKFIRDNSKDLQDSLISSDEVTSKHHTIIDSNKKSNPEEIIDSSKHTRERTRDHRENGGKQQYGNNLKKSHREDNGSHQNRLPGQNLYQEEARGSSWTSHYPVQNIIKEIKNDLFKASTEFSLAHCVAKDFRMGSGIAVKFKSEFKRVPELMDQGVDVGGCAFLKDDKYNRYIFYMVTKSVSNGKPTYESVKSSLCDMRNKCKQLGVTKLAMPRIACGLDKLNWEKVKIMINEVFLDTDIQICVYEFNLEGLPEAEGNRHQSSVSVKYNLMNLINIAPQTALLFFGTEDGHMDSTAMSLKSKFNFESEYKKAPKQVGSVFRYDKSTDFYIYCLIISPTFQDKVVFSRAERCFHELSKLLRKDRFWYVGVEALIDWNKGDDDTLTEKFVTLLRNTLPKSSELWVCYRDVKNDVHKMCKRS